MEDVDDPLQRLLQRGAQRLRGHQRRLFQAEGTLQVCGGSPRLAETRFGWGRATVRKGLCELRQGIRCLENFAARGRPRWEEQTPGFAQDLRALAEPRTQADPELKSTRRYTNLSAREALQQLQQKGYAPADLPSERTMRAILNRLGYRLQRIQKGRPLKKLPQTEAIFANLRQVQAEAANDPQTLEISVDTKAKVHEGDYARGGKNPDRRRRPGGPGLGP